MPTFRESKMEDGAMFMAKDSDGHNRLYVKQAHTACEYGSTTPLPHGMRALDPTGHYVPFLPDQEVWEITLKVGH